MVRTALRKKRIACRSPHGPTFWAPSAASGQEIATAAVFLAGPGASYMTGQTVVTSGGRVMLPG